MEYFVIAALIGILCIREYAHLKESRDVREERAFLTQVAVSKDANDFARRVNPVPAEGPAVPDATRFWDSVEGYEEQVGL